MQNQLSVQPLQNTGTITGVGLAPAPMPLRVAASKPTQKNLQVAAPQQNADLPVTTADNKPITDGFTRTADMLPPDKKQELGSMISRMEDLQYDSTAISTVVQNYTQEHAIVPEKQNLEKYGTENPNFFDKVSRGAYNIDKSLVQGIGDPFVRAADTVYRTGTLLGGLGAYAGNKIIGHDQAAQQSLEDANQMAHATHNIPGFHDIQPYSADSIHGLLDAAGGGIDIASNLLGAGEGKALLEGAGKQTLKQLTLQGAKEGAIAGGVNSFGKSLETTDGNVQGLGNTVGSTIKGTLGGALGGAVLGGATGAVAGAEPNLSNVQPISKTPGKLEKLVLGDTAQLGRDVASNPSRVKAFQRGTATVQDIANKTTQAAQSLQEKSINELQTIKDSIPAQIQFSRPQIDKGIKTIVKQAVGLIPDNQAKVNGLLDILRNHKDFSARGLLDLNTKIDHANLYVDSPDYAASNRVIQDARNFLKGKVVEKAPYVADALKQASDNITFLDQLKGTIIGNNPEKYVGQTEAKLNTVINKADDPTRLKAAKDLITRLEEESGFKISPDIQAAATARALQSRGVGSKGFLGSVNPFKIVDNIGDLLKSGALKGYETVGSNREKFINKLKVKNIKTDLKYQSPIR